MLSPDNKNHRDATFTTEKQNLQIILDQPDRNTKNVLANLRYFFHYFYYAFIFCTLSTLNLGIWRILTELSHFKGNAPLATHHPRPSPASSFFFSNFLHNKPVTSGQRLILCLRSWDTGATKRARVIKVFVPITSEMMKGANNAVINGSPPPSRAGIDARMMMQNERRIDRNEP